MNADHQTRNVLFLCTGNSARSLLGESIVNHLGKGVFRGYSAGSKPKGTVHPLAMEHLKSLHYPTKDLRSKSWDEFAKADAPRMDFIFTVCDRAAQESCPAWPGQPVTAAWSIPDPAAVVGSDAVRAAAFADAYRVLHRRIELFLGLPFDLLDRRGMQEKLLEIARL
jgi:arsenate reductase